MDTVAATGLTVQEWDDQFFVENLSRNRFAGEMGTNENSIIQVKEDLTSKKGKWITFALANRFKAAAKTNGQTLVDNEERLYTRSQMVAVGLRRNAFVVEEIEEQYSAIDLRKAGKAGLRRWADKDVEGMIIGALGQVFTDPNTMVNYEDASEATKDTWLTNNTDRLQFGKLRSNTSAADHSASLANIDGTDDKLTAAAVSLMKMLAKAADPRIAPIRSEANGRDYYVVYAGSETFRDLRNDSVIVQAQREVALQMENERLFKGGDLLWDNCIIKEVEDIPVYADVGAGGTVDVSPVYLCGAQAVGWAWSSRWSSRKRAEDDYGEKQGFGMRAIYGVEKLAFGTSTSTDTGTPKQHGVVTGYFAAEPNA